MKYSEANSNLRGILGEEHIGIEARAMADDHLDTKVWLRLLACSTQIENRIRELLRVQFGTTLPRFDYMAQLRRYPEGLRMKTMSRHLMVSDGNVTNLTKALVKSGHVTRVRDLEDRRSFWVRLTDKGRDDFDAMAVKHEEWLGVLFLNLPNEYKEVLYATLGRLRVCLVGNGHTASPSE